MANINDAKFKALRDQGFTGSISDMTLQWLQANGAAGIGNINDAWKTMLQARVTGGEYQRNDYWYALLGDRGYTGSLNDRALAFWTAGGTLP